MDSGRTYLEIFVSVESSFIFSKIDTNSLMSHSPLDDEKITEF